MLSSMYAFPSPEHPGEGCSAAPLRHLIHAASLDLHLCHLLRGEFSCWKLPATSGVPLTCRPEVGRRGSESSRVLPGAW